jgi:predicted component of type VI protein secretion system
MNKIQSILVVSILSLIVGCTTNKKEDKKVMQEPSEKKTVVYQVFTRLFGNTNTNNKPWGTIKKMELGSLMILQIKHFQKLKI